MRRWVVCLFVSLTLLSAACKGDSDSDDTATRATTTTAEATTTTAPTDVAGIALDATTTTTPPTTAAPQPTVTTRAPATTSTTVRSEFPEGAYVNDAPRDAHSERTDNSGALTYSATPAGAASPATVAPNDPLEFTIACTVGADGHGACHLVLVNHVTRSAQFPGGLRIVITMQKKGGAASDFEHVLANVTTLRPGERAEVDATFDLTEQGEYTYTASTTVAWP